MFENFEYVKNAPLKNFSTMRVGGKAKWIVFPRNQLQVKQIMQLCQSAKIKSFVLGNGSNVLFSDDGFDGAVICLKKMTKMLKKDQYVWAEAGVNLFALNQQLAKMGLSGLEWSYGVPGTVGGFVVMNGGCFGHEICEFVEKVTILKDGKIKILTKQQIDFSYRHSSLCDCVVLNIKLKLKKASKNEILENMQKSYSKKLSSQPCDLPSLGSIFKLCFCGENVVYPAKIIDNLGLKGVKIGGAEVSSKHAGFVVNIDNATSKDVLDLVVFLEEKMKTVGVFPEREIIVVEERNKKNEGDCSGC